MRRHFGAGAVVSLDKVDDHAVTIAYRGFASGFADHPRRGSRQEGARVDGYPEFPLLVRKAGDPRMRGD